jgi:hypothetical protein
MGGGSRKLGVGAEQRGDLVRERRRVRTQRGQALGLRRLGQLDELEEQRASLWREGSHPDSSACSEANAS